MFIFFTYTLYKYVTYLYIYIFDIHIYQSVFSPLIPLNVPMRLVSHAIQGLSHIMNEEIKTPEVQWFAYI